MGIKKILLIALAIQWGFVGFAQSAQVEYPSKNWFNEDAKQQKVNGVSTDEAYAALQGKQSRTVVVAVIDSGIDIDHEDLRDVIWTNVDEIAGNGIDDDKNGYIDDIHGWNFIGGKNGMNVGPDNLEVTREYRRLRDTYQDKKPSKKADYLYWQEIEQGYKEGLEKALMERSFYDSIRATIERNNQLLTAYLNESVITLEDLQKVNSPDPIVNQAVNFMGNILMMIGDTELEEVIGELEEAANHYDSEVEFSFNADYNPRTIIGDDPNKLDEIGYGNNDVKGIDTDFFHGTHVAGIIAAKRNNGLGIDGIANDVKIMALRTVPDGDEHDKDVANAIRYAVDNGAEIINMSFGKGYSPDKAYVDEAVKYAEQKGVLLIHAAGNSSFDLDVKYTQNFPNKRLAGKEMATNWIEVGASSWGNDDRLAASFSNYGKRSVDIFAPGVEIYSTAPANKYETAQGTSMASPVVTGVAALLLSYFPDLTPADLREILMQSSRKFDGLKVIKPGTANEMVDFADLSISGGVVNAFEAVKLAESRKITSR